jgi:hypothetical protein
MSKLTRVRAVPWLLVFEAVRSAQSHVLDVTSPAERRRVLDIIKRSKGIPTNLTQRERDDLRKIARKIDLKKVGQGLVPHAMEARRRRR